MTKNKVYLLCRFSHETSDYLTPHDIVGVYANKETLAAENPNCDIEWFTPRTSQACCGVAHSNDGKGHFFILVRHLMTNGGAFDTGELWDELDAEWAASSKA